MEKCRKTKWCKEHKQHKKSCIWKKILEFGCRMLHLNRGLSVLKSTDWHHWDGFAASKIPKSTEASNRTGLDHNKETKLHLELAEKHQKDCSTPVHHLTYTKTGWGQEPHEGELFPAAVTRRLIRVEANLHRANYRSFMKTSQNLRITRQCGSSVSISTLCSSDQIIVNRDNTRNVH